MRLLLGIGGSEDSLRALEVTVERAKATGDELTVAVLDNPDTDLDQSEIANRARQALSNAGLGDDVGLLEGEPGPALVDLAEGEGFDRIVLGGGKTSPLGKVQLGSITEFVVLNSNVTVTLVR